MPILEFREVTKRFGDVTAVNDVSFEIAQGEYVVIVGPSGSGKTTLLLMLGGFETPDAGHILINDVGVEDLPPAKRNTATVFQDYALFPHMRVLKNVEFGLKMRNVAKEDRRRQALDMLELVGLEGLEGRRPHELSGGQRQRVALARSLVIHPDIILLDEPLGALDAALRRQMQRELKSIQKQVGITFVHVTHDQEEAMHVADRIIVLHNGDLQDNGTPQRVYHRPRSLFAAQFMGDNNLVEGAVAAMQGHVLEVSTALGDFKLRTEEPPGLEVGSHTMFTIRPESVRVVGDGDAGENVITGAAVKEINFAGSYTKLVTEVEGFGEFKVQLHGADPVDIATGQSISLKFEPSDAFLLEDGRG